MSRNQQLTHTDIKQLLDDKSFFKKRTFVLYSDSNSCGKGLIKNLDLKKNLQIDTVSFALKKKLQCQVSPI